MIVGSVAAPAGAQNAVPARQEQAESAGRSDTLEVSESYPGLLRRAAIGPEIAVRSALGKVKGGHLVSTRIEVRGGRLVYVIRVDERRGQPRECLVDAQTGRLLANRKLARNRQGSP